MRDRAFSGSAYLLATLVTAVVTVVAWPVLFVPAAARSWAAWHRRRAAGLLSPAPTAGAADGLSRATAAGQPDAAASPPPGAAEGLGDGRRPGWARSVGWALAHIAVGLPLGLAALLCLGNIVVAAVASTLWWAFPSDARPTLGSFLDVHVDDWPTALLGG